MAVTPPPMLPTVDLRKKRDRRVGYVIFFWIFLDFFKNYLGYLKIKEATNTLRIVCFLLHVKLFGWYVSAKDSIGKVCARMHGTCI